MREFNKNGVRLVVSIDAHFDWRDPPSSPSDDAVRRRTNVILKETTNELTNIFETILVTFASLKAKL